MNEKVRNNKSFSTFNEFKNKVTAFFNETWGTLLPELKLRINDNFQKLKQVTSIWFSIAMKKYHRDPEYPE